MTSKTYAVTLIEETDGKPTNYTTPVQSDDWDNAQQVVRIAKLLVECAGGKARYSLACFESYDPSRPAVRSERVWFVFKNTLPIPIGGPQWTLGMLNVWDEIRQMVK